MARHAGFLSPTRPNCYVNTVMRMPKLRVASREIAAFARQAWLLRHDVVDPVLPREVPAGDHVVVWLHGLFATAGVMRPLRQRLERHANVHTASLTYPIGPGIESLVERLAALLGELPDEAKIHLVGHSLGGVVARFYAQQAGDARVVQTVSLGTPFAGVRSVSRLGVNIARDLDPDSAVLRTIFLGSARRLGPPHLSIVADADQFVRSPVSHALPGGDVAIIRECGHNGLLYHREVAQLLERRILAEMSIGA